MVFSRPGDGPEGVDLRRLANAVSTETGRAQPGEIENIPPVENDGRLGHQPMDFRKIERLELVPLGQHRHRESKADFGISTGRQARHSFVNSSPQPATTESFSGQLFVAIVTFNCPHPVRPEGSYVRRRRLNPLRIWGIKQLKLRFVDDMIT